MSDENFFSKKGQRIVSAFIGQGLLFDYITDELDAERRKAVEDYVRSSPEAQADIQKIQSGIHYVQQLRGLQVSDELAQQVAVSSSYTQALLDKIRFNEWRPAFKMALEGTVVALGITVFAILIPWHKVMDVKFGSRDVVLSEVEKSAPAPNIAETVATSKEGETFPDEGTPAPSPTTTTISVAGVTQPTIAAQTPTPVTTSTTQAPSVPVAAKTPQPVAASERKQGQLYRGTISVTNVQAVTPKFVEKVQELGGRKAGQVELGWFKGDSSYFHFTMPDGRYNELQEFFKEYGVLTIQQEAHERVMPEGIRRIIITVLEKK